MKPNEAPQTISDILRSMKGKPISTQQVCNIFGMSRPGLHKMTKRAAIPHHRLGSRIVFDPTELLRWWEAGRIG